MVWPHMCSTVLIGHQRAEDAGCEYQAERNPHHQCSRKGEAPPLSGTIKGTEKELRQSSES